MSQSQLPGRIQTHSHDDCEPNVVHITATQWYPPDCLLPRRYGMLLSVAKGGSSWLSQGYR
uniref:Uncharacterized protein n=1 Tax=Anguilla anguilla TaxID=7936 RepID=A0A0E9TBC2_ANGAN